MEVGARAPLLAVLAIASVAAAQTGGEESGDRPASTFGDTIEVHRTIADLRVIDGRWRPVLGLGPEDFRVRIDGRPVAVEAVEWWPVTGSADVGKAAIAAARSPGRLIVLFIQSADFYMQAFGEGHMRLRPRIQRWLEELPPADRVTVLRYGGSLRLESDFTTDRARLRAAVDRAVLGRPGPLPLERPRAAPSLAIHLDPDRARRATTVERALAVTGEALAAIPGPKTMIFAGWGLGVTGSSHEWSEARAALGAARTSVFVLDVVTADDHTLGRSLETMASTTGGTYASTYPFAQTAMRRLDQTLAGHYTLVLVTPPLPTGEHELRVRLVGAARSAGRQVLAPDAVFVD